jgi:hypothetical protein
MDMTRKKKQGSKRREDETDYFISFSRAAADGVVICDGIVRRDRSLSTAAGQFHYSNHIYIYMD